VLVSYGETIPGFDEYANSARDSYLFGHYADSNLPTLPESVSLPAIILFKQFDEGYAVFPADQVASASSDSLAAFVKENSVPLFDEISPENFGTYAGQGLPIAYLFADPESASERDALVKDLTPLAKEHKGKMSFVHIDAIKFIEHGKSLNLAGDKWPAFVIQDLAEGTKYPSRNSSRLSLVVRLNLVSSPRLFLLPMTPLSSTWSRISGMRSWVIRRRISWLNSLLHGVDTVVCQLYSRRSQQADE
jgi:hypothetical protein